MDAAVNSIHNIAKVSSTEVAKFGRELKALHESTATAELRRKRDADRLCAAVYQQHVFAADRNNVAKRFLEEQAQTGKQPPEPWCLNPEAADRVQLIRTG